MPENQELATEFVRKTTKYWIRTPDISRLKHTVLQHLPVFQINLDSLHGDSQLTNSVYLDNDRMELYHARLEKHPHAIAIRLRWYDTGMPKVVFVERKTHKDSWTGELSVKVGNEVLCILIKLALTHHLWFVQRNDSLYLPKRWWILWMAGTHAQWPRKICWKKMQRRE